MNQDSLHRPTCVTSVVDGVALASQGPVVLEVINPSSGQPCIWIPAGCDSDVDRAVASSRRAFEDGRWGDAGLAHRKRALHRLSDFIDAKAAVLDALDAEEMGKPLSVTRANALAAAGLLRFYAEAIDKVIGDVHDSDKDSFVAQRRVARGVVAAVVSWNFPTYNAVLKVAPALAAGNCVVLKPSELSSRSAILLAQLAVEAGIPAGVLNVVPGIGETVGRALGLHNDVDMLTFTGSTEVGKRMLQYAGQSNMKVIMAECGGKSPHIVFSDGTDLDAASDWIADSLLTNQGQICSVGSRLVVERSIERILVEKIAARMRQIVMGDAMDPKTTFGPVASEKQCTRIMQYIETAESEGVQLVTGGRRALLRSGGFFVEPTVFRNVSPTTKIAQHEIFGPVLSVMTFEDEGEAIRIANGTAFGLIAYVWTHDLSRGMRMAKAIRSSVLINAATPRGAGAGPAAPYEPAALSGIGTEGGVPGMESYLRRQLVWINYS